MNFLEKLGISEETYQLKEKYLDELKDVFKELDKIREKNVYKVLNAMQEANLSEYHLVSSTGYGYNDVGRDKAEEIFKNIFNTESAIVRTQIVSGTHALTLALRGLLNPNNHLYMISGLPYDTIIPTLGLENEQGSLKEIGITYSITELDENADFKDEEILQRIFELLKQYSQDELSIYIQRSSGYTSRKAISINKIERIIKKIKLKFPNIKVMVDNCYGEFVEELEPTDVGADVIAGSLIKNVGGSLAVSGGYICGKSKIIERALAFLTTPSLLGSCGISFNQTRNILQGIFIAPQTVINAVKSSILCAKFFENLGFEVEPKSTDKRSDIVQVVKLGNSDYVKEFCQAIQRVGAVDSHITPIAEEIPSYGHDVIMAGPSFVQGATIELSADAPIREPYNVYMQGSILSEHGYLATMLAYEKIKRKLN